MPRIVLPLPPSVNHCYKRIPKGMILTAEAKSWKELAGWEVRATLKGWRVANEKVVLEIWVYWGSHRKRDCDNLLKLLQDSLIGIIYADDRWALPRVMDWDVDDKRPRIEMNVRLKG